MSGVLRPGATIRASSPPLALVAALLVVATVAFWLSEPYPLSHAHWDSAVYLVEGKSYADGGYLPRLRGRASAVRDELVQGGYPRESWLFTRLGHIVIVGETVEVLGAKASIGAIVALYRILFAFAVLAAVVGAMSLAQLLEPDIYAPAIRVGAAISLIAYLLSDIASYMSGNLVSEVPAMLLLASSVWALSAAWARRSLGLAVLSGCLGFVVYAVRMEAVWQYLSFLIAFGVLIALPERNVKPVVVSAATALVLFLAYSWVFFPLTDPRLFALATSVGVKLLGPSTGGTVSQIIAANGLLWIGAALALPLARSSRMARVGFLWLVLAMLPVGVALATNYATQTRMFTMFSPILMLLSTIGWASLVRRTQRGKSKRLLAAMLVLCAVGAAISQPATYNRMHALPGMWRLQYVREYLASQQFERIDYYLPELEELSRTIAKLPAPCTIIVSERLQAADHIEVIQYLGAFGADAWNESLAARHRAPGRSGVSVYLSTDPSRDLEFAATRSGQPLFLLRKADEKAWAADFANLGKLEDVEVTSHFVLTRVTTSALARRTGARDLFALLLTR